MLGLPEAIYELPVSRFPIICLIQAERARGRSIDRRLLTRLAVLVVERNCARLQLSVLDWNPTRDFYHRIDFRQMHEWLPYRLDGQSLTALAETDGA